MPDPSGPVNLDQLSLVFKRMFSMEQASVIGRIALTTLGCWIASLLGPARIHNLYRRRRASKSRANRRLRRICGRPGWHRNLRRNAARTPWGRPALLRFPTGVPDQWTRKQPPTLRIVCLRQKI